MPKLHLLGAALWLQLLRPAARCSIREARPTWRGIARSALAFASIRAPSLLYKICNKYVDLTS
jgi:hypothetical protein